MLEPLPLCMLSITWHIAKHGGIDGLIKYLDKNPLAAGQNEDEK